MQNKKQFKMSLLHNNKKDKTSLKQKPNNSEKILQFKLELKQNKESTIKKEQLVNLKQKEMH